jgi:hypothetical protein
MRACNINEPKITYHSGMLTDDLGGWVSDKRTIEATKLTFSVQAIKWIKSK